MANTVETDWDESSPAIDQARRAGAAEINSLRKGVRLRMSKEHVTLDNTGAGGEHKPGAAISYYQSSTPTLQPDGATTLNNTTDKGRLWVHSGTKVMKVWSGTTNGWVDLQLAVVPAQTIDSFEVVGAGSSQLTPLTKTSLTNGTWLITVHGILTGGAGNDTVDMTVNTVARSLVFVGGHFPPVDDHFVFQFIVTVGSGAVTITATHGIRHIQAMVGIRLS